MATATDSDRKRKDREAHRRRVVSESLLIIPGPEDRERRELLESDDEEWLLYYFADGCGVEDPFTYKFTAQQRDMITAIGTALRHGGDQSIAASRGEGKTTIAERLALKYVLQGSANYIVIFAATGPMAETILDSLNTYICDNERLIADYPEVCIPVNDIQGAKQKAQSQRANGERIDTREPFEMAELRYSWCGNEFIFPDVPGSPSARAVIATRGLDAAVRGIKRRGKRPKLAIIDDPDTEDTARSEDQAKKLERRIDAAIGGLGGQRRSIGRVILTTLQSRTAVSYKLTDPKQKPTFKGRRYRYLIAPSQRQDLCDEYVAMRLDDLQQRDETGADLDPFARRSHAFYLEHRDRIEAGVIVSNQNRYDASTLADCTQAECSAFQAYLNLIAKLGPEVVATEYDNDPPEESAVIESGLSATRIQKQLNGYDRRVIPPGCTTITVGVDVRKVALHWVARAWQPDATGHTIDYGVHEVHGTQYGVDDGVDEAVRKSILSLVEQLKDVGFCDTAGEVKPIDMILIDAGWKTDAVYAACAEVGLGIMPVMGFGHSSGCTQANFSLAQRATTDKRPGDGWFLSRRGRLWLVCSDADRWKNWEHDRWMTTAGKPGSMQLFGEGSAPTQRLSNDEKSHHAYARHITNEAEVEEPHKGTIRRRWKAKSDNTHWLDASCYASVAANMKGVRLATSSAAVVKLKQEAGNATRPSLKQMKGK